MTDYLKRPLDIQQAHVASAVDEMSYWAARFATLIFENLELRPNLQVLDLGTGTGCPLFELAHMHGTSCQFIGLDPWRAGLKRAAQKLDVYGLDNVHLIEGTGEKLPFPSQSIDLIVGNVLLNNLPQLGKVLRECHRVLKGDGRFVMTTNLVGHMRQFYSVYRRVLEDFDRTLYLTRLDENEAHRGTKEQHLAVLETMGFRITRVVEDNLTLRYLNGSAMLRHSLVRFGFLDGWRRVVDSYDEERVFQALEDRLNALAEREGELQMAVPMLYIEACKG
jgi:ubiquinone/menaquinone biosynthesis C-methylase UbiE